MRTTELVQRYATRRDAEAFAELVREYQEMVLATCRRRLRSQADVDDAVQETFLKLARSSGSLRANVAAWLHRCAVNVSIDLNRRGEARARHESAAASAPPVDTTEAQRELAALREQLDTALSAIDEPSRELILQRFFVGRSQVDLAAEANVSPSTLSQRLDRAIEALREKLHLAGLPAAVLLGSNDDLTALLDAEHASAIVLPELTASLNAIGVAGVTARSVGLISAACVALLLVLAVGIWLNRGPWTGPTASTNPTSQPNSGTGMIAGAVASPNWQAPAEPADAALFGRVTDEAGNPIANASIDLNGGPSTTTDADGRYRIRSVRGEADFLAGVSAKGFVPIRPYGGEQDVAVRLTPTGHVQRNWVLKRGVIVNVHVADAGGEPLKSLEVECAPAVVEDRMSSRAFSETVRLDAEGKGTVFVPASNQPYVLMATAKGRAPAMLRFTPKSVDEPLDISVTLDAGVTIEGVALCTDGKPATGWSISAKPIGWVANRYPIPFAQIDKDGRFTIPHAPLGAHDVGYNIPDGNGMSHGRSIGRFDFVAGGTPLQLAVPTSSPASLATIKGTIQWIGDPRDNSAAYGASIEAQRLDSQRVFYSTAIRGKPSEQNFTLANVEPGEYRITISGTNFERVTLDRVTVPGELPPIEITVAGKPTLAGIVTDVVTGKPTTNFAYRLRKLQTLGRGPNYVGSSDWVQVNDHDGKFRVELVGPGVYQVQISAADRAWVWSAPIRAEALGTNVEVKVPLSAGGSLRGVVTNSAGKPLAGAKVIPLSYAQSTSIENGDPLRFDGEAGAVLTNHVGAYELHRLPAGAETLKVVHPDFAPVQVANIQVVDVATREVPAIKLTPGGRVEGTVYNNDGSIAPDAPIYFRDSEGYSGHGDQNAGTIAMATTDSAGRFAVDHLAEQTLWASMGEDRWQGQGVLRRVVRPQEGKTATLDFGGETTVMGRLVASTGAKANTRLALSSGDRYFGAFYANCTTDADGRFTLRGIPRGRYVLYADAPNDRIQLAEVNVSSDTLDLGDVSDDRGRVTLTIEADDPNDLAAIESVELTPDQQATGWSPGIARFQREGGRWTCDDVPSGKHLASVRLKSYRLGGRLAIERKIGDGEMSLSMRLPKRSATLHYAPATQPSSFYAQVADIDGATWANVAGDKPLDIALPPGTFRFVDWMSAAEIPLPPITVREGETIAFTPPLEPPVRHVPISIWLWTCDGSHITDASATLLDASGVVLAPRITRGHERLSFALLPGRYTLKMERPCGAPFEQSIDVVASDGLRSDHAVDVVVR